MPSDAPTSPRSLAERRAAIAAALRAVQAEQPAAPAAVPEIDTLREQVRRLADRVERMEHKVDRVDLPDDEPLAWPAAVDDGTRLQVPPFEVARTNSPAFDVLLGAG